MSIKSNRQNLEKFFFEERFHEQLGSVLSRDTHLLLHGPYGAGKSLLLMALAKKILCTDPKDTECRICLQIEEHTHPDFIVFEQGTKIGIDELRERLAMVYKTDFHGLGKVVLISDLERLSPEARQVLLKVLEEPPGRVTFLLSTSYPDLIPVTIKSRCISSYWPGLSVPKAAKAATELYGLSADEAQTLSLLSNGRLGLLAKWCERGYEKVLDSLKEVAKIATLNTYDLFKISEKWSSEGEEDALLMYLNYLRVCALVNAGVLLPENLSQALSDLISENKTDEVLEIPKANLINRTFRELGQGNKRTMIAAALLRIQ